MSNTNVITGKDGEFKIASTEYAVTAWTITPNADLPDATNTMSAGFGQVAVGIKRADGSLTFQYNPTAAESPISSMTPGTYLDNVTLRLNASEGFANVAMVIESIGIPFVVDGLIECTITFKSQGWDYTTALAAL